MREWWHDIIMTLLCIPASMLTTESRIFSMDWTGLHLSVADSYPRGSSPGVWRMEIQTRPSGYTTWTCVYQCLVAELHLVPLGWNMSDINLILGGLSG